MDGQTNEQKPQKLLPALTPDVQFGGRAVYRVPCAVEHQLTPPEPLVLEFEPRDLHNVLLHIVVAHVRSHVALRLVQVLDLSAGRSGLGEHGRGPVGVGHEPHPAVDVCRAVDHAGEHEFLPQGRVRERGEQFNSRHWQLILIFF